MNYSEYEEKRKRGTLNRNDSDTSRAKEQLKIKSERITSLKKAIHVLNQQKDKKEVVDLDNSDIEQFEDLLDEAGHLDDEIPTTINECGSGSSTLATNDDTDDLILIGAPRSTAITAGISPIELDREFSLEYTYTTDVSPKVC